MQSISPGSRLGLIVLGLIELALAYLFGSLAVNSGSLWEWMLMAILLYTCALNAGRLLFWRRSASGH